MKRAQLTVSEFTDDYQFISDSQDIIATLDSIGQKIEGTESTALMAFANEGEYIEVWSTYSSQPYASDAVFECIYNWDNA